jgi:hypothetical protein
MEPEVEAGDHTEVTAAALERPEEVRVVGRARAHDLAGSGHDLGPFQIVDGHAVLPAEPAEAAPERQPGDAGGGVDPDGRRETVGLCGGVEVREYGAALDRRPTARGVHVGGLHPRQVHHQPVVAEGAARDVVPAAAHGEDQPVVAREAHRTDHVRRHSAAGDHGGALVDHRVPDPARLIVGAVARQDDLALESLLQLLDLSSLYTRHGAPPCTLGVLPVELPPCRRDDVDV